MHRILLLLLLANFISCKTNQINNKKKQGLWIVQYELDGNIYLSKGRFRNNDEIGKWQHFENGKRVKKEIYRKNYTIKILYHPNGKIASKGKTKTNITEKKLHWFYDGIWKFYNEQGQLIRIKIYENSNLISDNEIISKK